MTQPVSPALQAAINAGQVDLGSDATPSTVAPETPVLQPYALPDGTVEHLDPIAATVRGAHLASDDEIKKDDYARRLLQQIQGEGFLGTLKAGGESFVGGLLPGGIDLLRSGMTPEEKELAAVRAKQHNLVSGAGELLGMAAQHAGLAALTGGAGEAANVGARAARAASSLGERVLTHAGKSVARGALAGGQMSFNEESRENLEHDAERVAHGALVGAILEPVLGIPLGLAADRKLAREIVQPLGESVTQVESEVLAQPGVAVDWAAQRIASVARRDVKLSIQHMESAPLAGGKVEKVLRKLPPEIASSGDKEIALEAVSGSGKGREYKLMAEHADKISNDAANASTTALEVGVDHTRRLLDEANTINFGKLVDRAKNNEIDQLGQEVITDINQAYQRVAKETGQTTGVFSKLSKYLPGFKDQYDKFLGSVAAGTVEEKAQAINVIRQQLGDAMSALGKIADNANKDEWDQHLAKLFIEELRPIQEKIAAGQRNSAIFGSRYAEAVGEVHDAISKLSAREKAMKDMGFFGKEGEAAWDTYRSQKGFKGGVIENILRRPDAPTNFKQAELLLGGSADPKSYLELVTDVSEAVNKHFSNNATREMTQDLLAANYLVRTLKEQTAAAWRAREAIQAASQGSGQLFSETMTRIGLATLGNVTLGPAAIAPAYALGGGLGHMLNYQKRLNALSSLENMLDRMAGRQQAGIREFIAQRGQKPGPPVIAVSENGQLVSAFRSMATNQAALVEQSNKLMQSVSTFAPKLAGMAAQKLTQVVSYINERVPAPTMSTNLMQPQKEKPYTKADATKIARMLTAAFRPESILTHPSLEGAQLVKDLFPNEFVNIQMGIIEQVSTLKKPLPFTVRQQMSLYFDLPADSLSDPKKYVELQEILNKSVQKAPKQRPIPIKISDRFQSITHKIEAS